MPNAPTIQKRDAIRERLTDALVLWETGRKHGAFIQALIALAGLASMRYPKKTLPKVYFDKMREYHPAQSEEIAANEKKHTRSELSDAQQFKCMVLDLIEEIILPNPRPGVHAPKTNVSLPFRPNNKTNFEDLFYKMLRCSAVHEGTFGHVAYLTERTPEGDLLHLTEPAGIPEAWVLHLIAAMRKTPELA